MANRLTTIYTRTGDRGDTMLATGDRVAKDSALIQAQGEIDELNSLLGLLASKLDGEIIADIRTLQNELFDFGAELSSGQYLVRGHYIDRLEQQIDSLNAELPPLKEFILPGGGEAASLCHLARAVCRRAERSLVAANREAEIGVQLLPYINRLSDLLFVIARYIAKQQGEAEVYWQSNRLKDSGPGEAT